MVKFSSWVFRVFITTIVNKTTKITEASASVRLRKVFAPGKPWQNFKPCDCRNVLFTYILNTTRSSLHARSFRRIHLSVFRYRLTKDGFAGLKSFRGFRETGPRSIIYRIICRVHIVIYPNCV